MKKRHFSALVGLSAMAAMSGANAAEKVRDRPELFRNLLDCRGIADNGQRLACYDRSVGAMEDAEKKKDLVVVDRKEIRETKKSLFGFSLPKLSLFGDGDEKEEKADEVQEIESTVVSVRPSKGGDWALRLANDAGTWETGGALTVPPRVGDKVKIRKASLGSYLGSVGISRGIRFRRVE
ncbi:MAG: hypothetical protein ACOY5R_18035 [Pseudomonadota bacterium]|uniref:hypothetical protein n=1 Tax=Rhizorhabdus phycosphaerae TaxID=2711156 RepID=UPI0013EE1784|nr:hypothetical protein [Rhizorhabdus phycosphaerae]